MDLKSSPYSLDQIEESFLLPPERIVELKEQLETAAYPALKKDGTPIPSLLVAPTTNGESAFLIDRPNAVDYMQKCILRVLLTEQEFELIQSERTRAVRKRRFEEQIEAAQAEGRITSSAEWDGGLFYGDEYYSNVDDLLDYLADEEPADRPEYLFAAKPVQVVPSLDVEDILQPSIESHGWEEMTSDDFRGVDELKAAVNKFVASNTDVVAYFEDTKQVIRMDYSTLPS